MTRACRLKSAWLWIVVSLCLRGSCVPEVNAEVEQLTFCGSSSSSSSAESESKSESKSTQDAKHQRSLIFVSTLDGKISALDAASDGKMQWMQDFNEGPMVSSNIHSRELSNNGQWVRLIPSLNGGLYKFDGENLENVPVSTEQLLRSSFRYSDDLVFSGGKETRSYGLSSTTGNILYECNIAGCKNKTDGDSYLEKEVLVVQRFQQTVRAVDPRTGFERWNFSVGQHEVVLIPGSNDGCHEKTAYTALDIELKVVIPEGLIWAISKTNPDVKLWQYKFDSPIVTIWREDTNAGESADSRRLKEISLFEDTPWEWGSEGAVSPGIYLGMHERQLYIQENKKIFKTLEYSSESTMGRRHKFPWRPHSASSISNEVATTPPTNSQAVSDKAMIQEIDEVQSTTALSVLYNSEYINGNGFYLYSREQLLLDNKQQCNSSGSDNVIVLKGNKSPSFFDDDEDNDAFRDDTPVQVIIVSLWYWWKEVLIISITTAILLNFMLTQRLLNATTLAKDAVLPPVIVESHVEVQRKSSESQDDSNNPANFKSRYLTDFEPIHCLGRGGYGVVFEAKNKIDDCNYAIKRIALPNSKDSRDRVMREVKALAKLDHYNIVRYFNAWLECPPVGWQEEHDEMWKLKQDFSLPETISEFSLNNTKCNNSICIDVPQSDQESSIESALEAYELNNRNRDVEDDSYIVFDFSEKGKNCQENIDITNCTDFSKSNGANGLPVSRDSSNDSESVIFQDDSSLSSDHSNHVIGRSRNSGKTPTSLSVKQTNKNSPKMFLYIQMQLCQRLSLREWLKHQITPRDPNRVLNIFQQIVEAVEYVHLQGLIHRDLKPSNIFFALDDKIKIGDFGLVTAMTEGYNEASTPGAENEERTMKASLHTARVGTHLYMSPEQMNGQAYNYKVDIYSLGIIFFELLTPFATDMERIMTLMDLKKAIFPKNFDVNYPSEYGLLKLMLDEDPQKRPTTLGIKARPPLSDHEMVNGFAANGRNGVQWHFELPQISPHSSVTNTSSSESWESISNARSSL